MASTTFFDLSALGLATDTNTYLTQWLQAMQASFPGYTPSSGNLEYIMAQVIASWAADGGALASYGSTNLFQAFGTKLVNLPYLQGVAASVIISVSAASVSGSSIAVLSGTLSTLAPITSIPVNPLTNAIAAGTITLSANGGVNTQNWTTIGAGVGATSIPVTSQTANYAYPSGTPVMGTVSYTLPVGTQFDLDGYGFQTISAVSVNSGATDQISLYAVETGSAYNGAGASGVVSLISQVDWVASTSIAPGYSASGGVDAEDDIHYLNRLAGTLQTMAQRPITANDYSIMALNFQPDPGTDQQEVGRAAAIDGALLISPVPRSVTIYVTDVNGNPLNSDTLSAIEAWFETLREANFDVTVSNATYQPIYVTVTVHANPAYTQDDVQANVQTAIIDWLSPANWGTAPPYGISGNWATTAVTIYRSQLEGIIQNTPGVDHVVTGTLAFGGSASPTNTTTDYALPGGVAILPVANTSTVPLSGITFA